MTSEKHAILWLRRDLRLQDHRALHEACASGAKIHVVFVFDTHILDPLVEKGFTKDRRVDFIHRSLQEIDVFLREHQSRLIVRHGDPVYWIPTLAKKLHASAVYTHKDYEPYACKRDHEVAVRLKADGCGFHAYKDHVVFEESEILTQQGTPFSVFTPYKKAWLNRFSDAHCKNLSIAKNVSPWAHVPSSLEDRFPTLEELGFAHTDIASHTQVGRKGGLSLLKTFLGNIDAYKNTRDIPSQQGTSTLSIHLRMGTVSIREAVRALQPYTLSEGRETWLSELVWREFYSMLLHHHPRLGQGDSFKPAYNAIKWRKGAHAERDFQAWCEGRTGYPFVDAGMLQLNQTGFMHNRLRMVTASFLVKDLGIDWRCGERYFAHHLNDFDAASNNGGWQWCSSSGCDAQPYFRIFNPITQSKTYDPEGAFIRSFIPSLRKYPPAHLHAPWEKNIPYTPPLVDHTKARLETLERYKKAGV